jgi:purine-binding chemotaxis protein CheW
MSDLQHKKMEDDLYLLTDDEEDTQANKFLSFKLGNEAYGIGIKHIIEIIELQKVISVPDLPDYVKGVINLRGKVIPVLDLRIRFGMEERVYDDRTCIVIVSINNLGIGLIVDNVDEVLEIIPENIEPPPKFKSRTGTNRYINGIGKVGAEVKILLDVEKILYEKEIDEISKISQDEAE